MTVNAEEARKRIAALRRERTGYVAAGKEDRVKLVDDQIELYGKILNPRKLAPQGRAENPQTTRGQT